MKRTVKQPEVRKQELITAALKIFCEKGYEQTSIRDILDEVGGEVGMFYHYFKSKDEIFGLAVALFLEDYIAEFIKRAENETGSLQQNIEGLIVLIDKNITKYRELWAEKVHWSMAAAIHKSMLDRMVPVIERLIIRAAGSGALTGSNSTEPRETARFLLYGISGVLHERPLAETSTEEYQKKLRSVLDLVSRFFDGR